LALRSRVHGDGREDDDKGDNNNDDNGHVDGVPDLRATNTSMITGCVARASARGKPTTPQHRCAPVGTDLALGLSRPGTSRGHRDPNCLLVSSRARHFAGPRQPSLTATCADSRPPTGYA
jgi:hypothetical protein